MKTKTLLLLTAAAIAATASGCSTTTTTTYKSVTVETKPSGVYAGAVTFGGEIRNVTGGKPVFMNHEGLLYLIRAISVRYQPAAASNAGLSGAMEKAVADINSGYEYLPGDVESVNLVVFTNRLPPAGAPTTLKAAGKDVTVYAVGATEGMDESALPEFGSRLRDIAGGDSRVYTVANLENADSAFVNIASRIAFARGKSAVVYFVLDAAPPSGVIGVEAAKVSTVALLDGLSERVDLELPTPLKEIYIDVAATKERKRVNLGETLMIWGVTVLCVGLIAGLSALVVSGSE